MAIKNDYLSLLKKYQADDHKHGTRQLIDHLIGTYNILKDWNVYEDLCLAGLFHSIYGTEFHLQAATGLEQREEIKNVIGERAEFLAYVFCVSKRLDLFDNLEVEKSSIELRNSDQYLELTKQDILDIFILEIANIVEQIEFFENISPSAGNKYLIAYEKVKNQLPQVVSNAFVSLVNKSHPNPLIRPSMYGDIQELQRKIDEGNPVDDFSNDKRSATALMYATVYNQAESVRTLIKNDANPNISDKYGNLPIEIARKNRNQDIISLLSKQDSN